MKSISHRWALALIAASLGFVNVAISRAAGFTLTNLVSDQPGVAVAQDPNLVNSWGLAASASGPFWSANNGTATATIYTSTTPGSVTVGALVVSMPAMHPITGAVFNGTASFNSDLFIFAAEDGTLSGWRGALGTNAETVASTPGANYKGLAIANNGANHLYAADFATNAVRVFDSSFALVNLGGSFTDPNLPAGYSPFNIRAFGSQLYVTYAVRDPATGDDVAAPGNGIVDRYDLNGNLLGRLITGGDLNSPWGLELAPAGFGTLAGDLLVGNFGDGRINAYDPLTGALVDTLRDMSNLPLTVDGLWALNAGNGGSGGAAGAVYFTAGPGGESHGLFGSIAVPEPSSLALLAVAIALLARRQRHLVA